MESLHLHTATRALTRRRVSHGRNRVCAKALTQIAINDHNQGAGDVMVLPADGKLAGAFECTARTQCELECQHLDGPWKAHRGHLAGQTFCVGLSRQLVWLYAALSLVVIRTGYHSRVFLPVS